MIAWFGRGLLLAVVMLGGTSVIGQSEKPAVAAHVAAAKSAAGQEHMALFNRLCGAPVSAPAPQAQPTAPQPAGAPDRSQWHAEPVKIFDSLYFVGQTEYSAWAVATSDGIIIIDAIFDYSVEDEVVNGLVKMGLDPTKIKYVLVSHGHSDHAGGARYLQDRFGAHVILSAADWTCSIAIRAPGRNQNAIWWPRMASDSLSAIPH